MIWIIEFEVNGGEYTSRIEIDTDNEIIKESDRCIIVGGVGGMCIYFDEDIERVKKLKE